MAIWIGYRHADRLITYPHPHNLSMSRQPIRVRGGYPPRLEHADLTPTTYPHAQRTPPAWGVPRGLRGVAVVPADGGREAQQHARHSGTAQVPASDGRAGLVTTNRGEGRAWRSRGQDTAHRHNQQHNDAPHALAVAVGTPPTSTTSGPVVALPHHDVRASHLLPAQPAARRDKTSNTIPDDEARHKPRDAEKPAGKARKSSPSVPCAQAGASRPGRNGFGPRCAAPRLRCR